jgi:hypothetical protein
MFHKLILGFKTVRNHMRDGGVVGRRGADDDGLEGTESTGR